MVFDRGLVPDVRRFESVRSFSLFLFDRNRKPDSNQVVTNGEKTVIPKTAKTESQNPNEKAIVG